MVYLQCGHYYKLQASLVINFNWASLYAYCVSKENLIVLCSLLNDWDSFWNKYCNLPFLAICCSLIPLWYFLRHPDIKKQKLGYEWACETKNINYHIKELYKSTCYKTKSNFPQFFFSHWLLHKYFFSFLIKAFTNFEKLIRFHWQAFIAYQTGENLKTLIEIFCQKLIVSNVILAFLDHLKRKIFKPKTHRGLPLFKISGSAPADIQSLTCSIKIYSFHF